MGDKSTSRRMKLLHEVCVIHRLQAYSGYDMRFQSARLAVAYPDVNLLLVFGLHIVCVPHRR